MSLASGIEDSVSLFDTGGKALQGMTEEDILQCFMSGPSFRLLTLKASPGL